MGILPLGWTLTLLVWFVHDHGLDLVTHESANTRAYVLLAELHTHFGKQESTEASVNCVR